MYYKMITIKHLLTPITTHNYTTHFFSCGSNLWNPTHLETFKYAIKVSIYEKCTLQRNYIYSVLSHSQVSDSATPWTGAHQIPLYMGILPGKKTGVGCRFLYTN